MGRCWRGAISSIEVGAIETCANAGNMAIAPKIPSCLVKMRILRLQKVFRGKPRQSRPVYINSQAVKVDRLRNVRGSVVSVRYGAATVRERSYWEAQVTEKLVPSLDSADGTASLTLPLVAMVISSMLENLPMGPVVVLSIAKLVWATPVLSSPKSTVPKSERGRIPPRAVQQGASAIHSADDRCAPETVELLRKALPVVSSLIVTVNSVPL